MFFCDMIYEAGFNNKQEVKQLDEDKLVKALRKGDTAALKELIVRYTPFVSSVIRRILKDRSGEWEELTQDVFLALWDNRKKLVDVNIKPYLAAIARNKSFSLLRRYREELPLDEDILIYDSENIELAIEQKELAVLVNEALSELSREHRELFIRHYYYGQTVTEAAREMDINDSTAKSWLKRDREKLKEILTKKGIGYERIPDKARLAHSPT